MELNYHYKDERGRLKVKRLALPADTGIIATSSYHSTAGIEIAIVDDGEITRGLRVYDDLYGVEAALDDLDLKRRRREFESELTEFRETNPTPVKLAVFIAKLADEHGIDLDDLDDLVDENESENDVPIAAE